jgi:hypothetical protein
MPIRNISDFKLNAMRRDSGTREGRKDLAQDDQRKEVADLPAR